MKKLLLIAFASATVFLFSCGGGNNNKAIKKVEQLTNRFFDFYTDDQYDSLKLIYPSANFDLLDMNADSIRITSVTAKENGQMEVQLIKNFSRNSTLEFNESKSISLVFDKANEGTPFEYTITNSMGLTNLGMISRYAKECGALEEKKYTDKDYNERLKVVDILCMQKAEQIAELLNKNVKITFEKYKRIRDKEFCYYFESPYVEDTWDYAGTIYFMLSNSTNYQCKGFETTFIVYGPEEDGKQKSKTISHVFDEPGSTLKAHSQDHYSITYNMVDWLSQYYANVGLSRSTFHITPEAVLMHTPLDFDGTEYDEYMSLNNGRITNEE